MSLVCRVAEVTNERWETIYKHWPLMRTYSAEIIWYAVKGYDCAEWGSHNGGLQTTI